MHLPQPPQVASVPARLHSERAFSLVEITLAIGIIAFAFVALFGLLPTGLTTFRGAVDSSNISRIVQDISTLVQATEYEKLDGLNFESTRATSYYDEEGNLINRVGSATGMEGSLTSDESPKAIYAEKTFFASLTPVNTGQGVIFESKGIAAPTSGTQSKTVTVLVCNMFSGAKSAFDSTKTITDVVALAPTPGLSARTFVIAKMDGVQ